MSKDLNEIEAMNNMLGIPSTIIESSEWKELVKKEYEVGADTLLTEIINKKLWTDAEIMWVIKRMVFFYGRSDQLLKKAPVDRLLLNMNDVLRAFYILFDSTGAGIDDNIRNYICTKLADASWGISERTRNYLYKF